MNPEHQKKIEELADSFASALKEEAQHLYLSGAIDEATYCPEEYVLAKILITAAIQRRLGDYMPPAFCSKYAKTIKKLSSV